MQGGRADGDAGRADRGQARGAGVPLDDDDLAARLGVVRQAVNQACRRLEAKGLVERSVGSGGKIVNRLSGFSRGADAPAPSGARRVASVHAGARLLAEDEVKAAVKAHLESQGYRVRVAWARERGIDLEASRADGRILLEAKGEAASSPQQVNYFLGALGELVQRMSDPFARYGLALPDNRQYRGLVRRLPALARQRLGLVVYFVRRSPDAAVMVEEA